MRKLFFGLWPPAVIRDQIFKLNDLVTVAGGRATTLDNLHLTLHFIGQTSYGDAIADRAQQIIVSPFELTLNHWGHFKKPRILWLGPPDPARELGLLAAECTQLAADCGSPGDARDYRPHVSLQRKILELPELPVFEPIQWQVDRFYLFESVSHREGVRYERIQEYA